MSQPAASDRWTSRVARIAPGLPSLLSYRFAEDFRYDLVAGVSVAAVALPVAVAYAQLAGFEPVIGLYSAILPLVAYALFGTSRQLMINPDASVCAIVATAVTPLAAGDHELYWSLAVTLTFLTGLFCIAASLLRLGALADFLSKPILVGYLNGVAISIFLGQIGKIFGFAIETDHIVPRLLELLSKLPNTHLPTLLVGVGAFVILFAVKRFLPRLPAALVTMIWAGTAVAWFGLEARGVAVLGEIQKGLPPLRVPTVPLEHLPSLLASAAGVALVLFTSGMLTSRSFAEKNGYTVDTDKDFAAFGAANIASALSQGFAVTGADSRTAMADASGGRTQLTGLVAAATIAAVLLFLTEPLSFVPIAALGAVLIHAALGLFNVRTLQGIWGIDRKEVFLAVLTTLGVVAVGAINAILIAVAIALLRFVKLTARPRVTTLGRVQGLPGLHALDDYPDAQTWPGLLIFHFDGPITFFNSHYFAERARQAAAAAGPELRWFVLDLSPVSLIDVTGMWAIRRLREDLAKQGVKAFFAGRRTQIVKWANETGQDPARIEQRAFSNVLTAVEAYLEKAAG
ncbi:MAG: SulP family inorganic anion transporter [Syntrophobacteraceae bacterium]|jgi:high affinity sulfate transporter 1|nr:SulP family inorganic anion transporter [Syntrophobacteraceae bacterium]